MFFYFVKKEVVLDCFTPSEIILQTAPITNAIKHVPTWWRKLPVSFEQTQDIFPIGTMKNCAGMVDYYSNSVAIPLWSDLIIKLNADGSCQWQFSDRKTEIIFHNPQQRFGFLDSHHHLKIESPWFLRTKESFNWIWSQPTYSLSNEIADIKVLPGVLNFNKQFGTNINFLLPKNVQKTYYLNHGQVLVHLTPMIDRKVKVVRHLVSQQEFSRVNEVHENITFVNKFKMLLKKREEFSNCPYKKDK